MTLRQFDLRLLPDAVSDDQKKFISDAEERIDLFQTLQRRNPVPGFVPSDFLLVHRVLSSLRASPLVAGNKFCEWGCGFGVVAALAANLGFDAVGIEVESRLVDEAVKLCAEYEFPVQFAVGSFIPEGYAVNVDFKEVNWLNTSGPSGYEHLGLDPDDFHVVYAYPWPGEEEVIYDLFEEVAGKGAILMTYHGAMYYNLFQKL